ncbi:MAG TPA: phosphatidate cytidylyltransferase [Steroidobacteraceae bacterium]|nr:phosphatidate cytidylyltransferase [Steroidobacteraceae bacterium]
MLKTRIVTASILGAALLVVVLWLPPLATILALTVAVLAGAWEWSAFLRTSSAWVRGAYVVLIAALLPVAWEFTVTPERRDALLMIALAWWTVALLWVALAPRRVTPLAAGLAGILALVPAWVALIRLLDLQHGTQWLLFALVLVWTADIGAFFFGRRYGRVPLAPAVSPGKTWEGVIGGFAASAFIALAGAWWFGVSLAKFLPLCIAAVAFSIVGDLTESLLKRYAGVKDSGSVFPGHGGVMDRIDSVTGAAPVLLLGLTALGVAT